MRAERACPDASKFETFIPLVQFVFELELFKPIIDVSVFGSETRITQPIAPKTCTKNDLYVPQLRFKFQVFTFSCFKVIAFFIFAYEFIKYAGKTEGLPTQSVAEVPITKKKCRNCHNLFWGAETACPDASKFETFIPLVRLVFVLELYEPPIGISVFGS